MGNNKCINTFGAGADPWVVVAGGNYYYISSNKGKYLTIQTSDTLDGVFSAHKESVWTPPLDSEYSKEIWAPELHFVFDRWYIYVAADNGKNENHRMYALEGSDNPDNPLEKPFTFVGKVECPTDRWAIDGTVAIINSEPYFVWSGWKGFVDVTQELYIAKMLSPTKLTERTLISAPELEWETRGGTPKVNEGPTCLIGPDNSVYIIYSASGSWSNFYCLGQLKLTGENPLEKSAWTKKAVPVFESTGKTFAPGHASFIQTPVEKENWIIYHTARVKDSGWDRIVRIQKFDFVDNEPSFGKPLDPMTEITAPAK